MNKDILKNKKNQACKENLFISRQMRRSRAFKRVLKDGYDPYKLYTYMYEKRRRGKATAYKVIKQMLHLGSHGCFLFKTTETLAQEIGVHPKSICRITSELADLGYIKKRYRGLRKSVILVLNPIFNNPIIQYLIAPLFPFMKAASFSFLLSTSGYGREHFIPSSQWLFPVDVTHIYNKDIFYNLFSSKVVASSPRRGVPEPVTSRGVPEASQTSSFPSQLPREKRISSSVIPSGVRAHGVNRSVIQHKESTIAAQKDNNFKSLKDILGLNRQELNAPTIKPSPELRNSQQGESTGLLQKANEAQTLGDLFASFGLRPEGLRPDGLRPNGLQKEEE